MSRHLVLLDEGGFLGLATIGDEASEEVNQEIKRAAVTSMLNVTNILELVVDALNDRPFVQQQLVWQGHGSIAHVLA